MSVVRLVPELVCTGRTRRWSAVAPNPSRRGSLATGYRKILDRYPERCCRIGTVVFVAGVRGRPRGAPPGVKGTAIMVYRPAGRPQYAVGRST